ncbi:MAG: hypothetical protein AAB473_05285 [Patescibacteria group bacterium]
MSNELPSQREVVEAEIQRVIADYREQEKLAASPDYNIRYGPKYFIGLNKGRFAFAALGVPQTRDGGAPFYPNWTVEDFRHVCRELGIDYEAADTFANQEVAQRTQRGAGKENN